MMNGKKYNLHYLDKITDVIDKALGEYPRILAVRVDLHLSPNWFSNDMITCPVNLSENVMARFTRSLDAKIKHYQYRSGKEGKRVHPCTLRYLWVKEIHDAVFPHYHVVLFLNKDAFRGLGNSRDKQSLWTMIVSAWLSALGLSGYNEYSRLVHFPRHCVYMLDKNSFDYSTRHIELFSRLSYLAKERTKVYSPDKRSMGCSQK
ncbi:inovirus Gp2 family protein [Citrobacter amalonaticus]|uniref:inovirus Gp2 family protein n=1 Tax=Citrobacter amalonaticus TaxID=35703 RepID=UPI003566A947